MNCICKPCVRFVDYTLVRWHFLTCLMLVSQRKFIYMCQLSIHTSDAIWGQQKSMECQVLNTFTLMYQMFVRDGTYSEVYPGSLCCFWPLRVLNMCTFHCSQYLLFRLINTLRSHKSNINSNEILVVNMFICINIGRGIGQ